MFVEDLINNRYNSDIDQHLTNIRCECSQFINEVGSLPLFKVLPKSYDDIQKVKARLKKKSDNVTHYFNKAFIHETTNLRQRAIFAYSTPPIINEQLDLFYVFPINNYKYLYSNEVSNSKQDYKQVMETVVNILPTDQASDIITDLLKYTYSFTNLREGILSNAEIIMYGIPYYYAVRVDSFVDYNKIIR